MQPGHHSVEVRQEGYIPFRAKVDIEPGVTTGAYADLVPETRYRTIRGSRIFTWIAGGLAVVALGTSVYFGARAASRQSNGDLPGARGAAATSDAFLGAAIGLSVATAILYFVEGRSVGTERIHVHPASAAH